MNTYLCSDPLTKRQIIDSLLNSSGYPIKITEEDYKSSSVGDCVIFSKVSFNGNHLTGLITRRCRYPSDIYKTAKDSDVEHMFIVKLNARVELILE